MKISNLIIWLETMKTEHGDITVVKEYDGQYYARLDTYIDDRATWHGEAKFEDGKAAVIG